MLRLPSPGIWSRIRSFTCFYSKCVIQLARLHRVDERWTNEYEVLVGRWWQGKAIILGENSPNVILSTKNLTYTGLPSKTLFHGGRPEQYEHLRANKKEDKRFRFLWPCIVSKIWREKTNKMQQLDLEVRHPRCVGSITKNFVYYTYSQTQLYFTY